MQNLRDENDEICEKGTITYLGSGKLVFVAFGTATNALRDYCYGILCLLVSIRRAKPNTGLRGGLEKSLLGFFSSLRARAFV